MENRQENQIDILKYLDLLKESLDQTLGGFENSLKDVKISLVDIQTKISSIDKTVANVNNRLTNTWDKIVRVEEKTKELKGKVDELEKDNTAMKTEYKSLKKKIVVIEKDSGDNSDLRRDFTSFVKLLKIIGVTSGASLVTFMIAIIVFIFEILDRINK